MDEGWHWEGGTPHACPRIALDSATDNHVTWLGPRSWRLDATEVLRAFARWCARSVLRQHLGAQPPAASATVWEAVRIARTAADPIPARQIREATLAAATLAAAESGLATPQHQSAWLAQRLHAEHELLQLDPSYRTLLQGTRTQRAVLRDIALQRGLVQLARSLE